MIYLSLDVETGGLSTDRSLLTLGGILANEKFESIADFHWTIKPNDGIYHVDGIAMKINGINLAEHDKDELALTYEEAGEKLLKFLQLHKGVEKLTVIGKNVAGDLAQIHDKLIDKETWEIFCSYRNLDVSSVAKYLITIGKLPIGVESLRSLCKHYSLSQDGLHDALFDAKMTLEVYRRMVEE